MKSEIRKIRLRTGFELEVMVGGADGGEPPLVIVPGVGGDKTLFRCIFDLLASDRRVVAVDLSPRVARGHSILQSDVDDLFEVTGALGFSRFDLLGQSYGALVVVRAARARPLAVRRLVLAGPATVPLSWAAPGLFTRWLVAGGVMRVCPTRFQPWVSKMIRRTGGFALEPDLDGSGFDELVVRVRNVRVRPFLRRLLSVKGHPWMKELSGIEAPVLVIEGDREAALLPSSVVTFFDERPHTKYVEMPGGHLPFLVRPEEFVATVRAFLSGEGSAASGPTHQAITGSA